MAYEAMNNAGAHALAADRDPERQRHVDRAAGGGDERLSVAAAVVAVSSSACASWRRGWRGGFRAAIERTARRAEEFARGMLTGGTLFEELGFYYVGPIDGHNLDHLLPVLRNVRDAGGAGADPGACDHPEGQGLRAGGGGGGQAARGGRFNVVTGEQAKAPPGPPSYTRVFADALIAEAEADPAIVAITAAMPAGTGLDGFARRFPDALLRRRHRRAARGDVCGGSGDARG